MQYRPFGKTGRMLSFLGIRPQKGAELAPTLYKAFEKGINYLDVDLQVLDPGEIREVRALLTEARSSGHPLYLGATIHARNGAAFRREANRVLEQLGADVIDFCHISPFANRAEWDTSFQGGIFDAAHQAQDDGYIRHISLESTADIATVLHAAEMVSSLIDGLNLHGPALSFPFHDSGSRFWENYKPGIMVQNSFAAGFRKKAKREYAFLKIFPDQTLLEASIHFMMSCEPVGLVVTQFENPGQVVRAVDAVDDFEGYSPEQLETVRSAVARQLQHAGQLEAGNIPEGETPPDEVDFLVFRLLNSIGSFLGAHRGSIVGRRAFHKGQYSDELKDDER